MAEFENENITGRKALVVGLGVSGFWTARWLLDRGAKVTVTDKRPKKEVKFESWKTLSDLGVTLELGEHRRGTFAESDLIVVSPGVPHTMPLLLEAEARGIPVLGEMELASRYIRAPMIAVTGTNGKSTVTDCLGSLLENAGLQAYVGGNIGSPLMTYVCGRMKADYVVAEVSSFQLDTTRTFSPFISIILNISPDHLDRYRDFEDYAASKTRIFSRQGPGQFLILNNEDERLRAIFPETGVSVLRYGLKKREGQISFVERGAVHVSQRSGEVVNYPTASFGIRGEHNILNLQSVILTGHLLGIAPFTIRKTLERYGGLSHRLEAMGEKDGIIFYDDSKATNVAAAVEAIRSISRPMILIAGGRHKGSAYTDLAAASTGHVKSAVLIGEAKEQLGMAFHGVIPYRFSDTLEEAVELAFSQAVPGDAVLLAPACSSFDMFSDYKERGEAFRKAFEGLARG